VCARVAVRALVAVEPFAASRPLGRTTEVCVVERGCVALCC